MINKENRCDDCRFCSTNGDYDQLGYEEFDYPHCCIEPKPTERNRYFPACKLFEKSISDTSRGEITMLRKTIELISEACIEEYIKLDGADCELLDRISKMTELKYEDD